MGGAAHPEGNLGGPHGPEQGPSAAPLADAFDDAPIGLALIDPRCQVTVANQAFEQMLECGRGELAGALLWELLSDGEVHDETDRLHELLERDGLLEVETRYRTRGGALRWVDLSVAPVHHDPRSVAVAVARDITVQKHAERELLHRATHDPLTGLANRSLAFDRLAHAVVRMQRGHGHVGAAFLDLDRFKAVNDSHGHAAGDETLRIVADRLTTVLRDADTVARVGGDEFLLCVEDLSGAPEEAVEEMSAVGVRLLRALDHPIRIDGVPIHIGGSLGVAIVGDPEVTVREITEAADRMMYRAKRRGGRRVELTAVSAART